MSKLTGKELSERWNMDGYQVLEMMNEVYPSPNDWESQKLIVGPFNTRVEFAKLFIARDEQKDLDNKIASFDFALSEIKDIEKNFNLLPKKQTDSYPKEDPRIDNKLEVIKTNQDHEEFIRNLRVSYENDNEIKIKVPGRKANCFTCESLGFRDNKTMAWRTFIYILENPPHTYNLGTAYKHYFVDSYSETFENEKKSAKYSVKGKRKPEYDKRRKRLVEISKKLKKFFQTQYSFEFPRNYNLHELYKTEKAGTYRFKFQVIIDDGDRGYYERKYEYYSKDKLVKAMELLAQEYQNNRSDSVENRISVAAKIALSKEWLSSNQIKNMIKS
jgi:hypothetical protein